MLAEATIGSAELRNEQHDNHRSPYRHNDHQGVALATRGDKSRSSIRPKGLTKPPVTSGTRGCTATDIRAPLLRLALPNGRVDGRHRDEAIERHGIGGLGEGMLVSPRRRLHVHVY